MAHAEALCAARAERLTPTRRQVLEALAASHRPLGAYEIIDRLPPPRPPAAPASGLPPPPGRRHDGVPAVRPVRRGRRGTVRRGYEVAHRRREERWLHAENAGGRDSGRVRPLPRPLSK